ncbi:MAG: hypothetical protein MUF39_08295, partial [Cyclobacteriaceae bacterium]|nr:hypothetical protein [Cyclobacteriaceae bacterium]
MLKNQILVKKMSETTATKQCKGHRHSLSEDSFQRVMREIDRMVKKETDLPALGKFQRVGFVFYPEYHRRQPVEIGQNGEAQLWLFGPGILPESPITVIPPETLPSPLASQPTPSSLPTAEELGQKKVQAQEAQSAATPPPEAEILLGYREASDDPVIWRSSIKANPHLIILGLPGMGKTTCLINLCQQLAAHDITPIVFSYHQDIDEKLTARLVDPPLTVRYAGLGFNPLQVDGDAPLAHLDNVGMLRDIFAAIFPELGDVQLGRLREALKQSYLDQGWEPGQRGATPAFRAFLDLLRADAKPDRGLLTLLNRFSELD